MQDQLEAAMIILKIIILWVTIFVIRLIAAEAFQSSATVCLYANGTVAIRTERALLKILTN